MIHQKTDAEEIQEIKEMIYNKENKQPQKKLNYILLVGFTLIYFYYHYLCHDRNIFLKIIFCFSLFIAFPKVLILMFYDGVIYLILKLAVIAILDYILVFQHNPFFNFFFYHFPFKDFFRGLIMIKFMNVFFEKNISNLKYEFKLNLQEKIGNLVYENYIDWEIFDFLFKFIFELKWKKIFYWFCFFWFVKISIFFYEDNTIDSSYQSKIREKKYFIAANLFNNEEIFDDWKNELVKLSKYLGYDRIYISIFENGDSKDNTAALLKEFNKELNELNIPNTIGTDKIFYKQYYDRIGFLELIRNKALEPMYDNIEWEFDEFVIIFLNDIVYKYEDIVKLIMTNDRDYDMACGMDWYYFFYDQWVARDLGGIRLQGVFPYFRDNTAIEQFLNWEPIRVFCCWNGVAIMNPMPFKEIYNFKFRISPGVMESECFLICKDYFEKGFSKIIINPIVKVAYEYYDYYREKYLDQLFKYHYYFYYYFIYWNNYNPMSADLVTKNITTIHDWRTYA